MRCSVETRRVVKNTSRGAIAIADAAVAHVRFQSAIKAGEPWWSGSCADENGNMLGVIARAIAEAAAAGVATSLSVKSVEYTCLTVRVIK